jgi:hypothetical protein
VCAALAGGVPRTIVLTALGAAVVLARAASAAWSHVRCVGGAEAPARHHAGRISEQVKAAERAARAAGVLRSPSRRA